MEKNDRSVFDEMFDNLNQGRLRATLRLVREYVKENPYLMYDEGLDDIERDYGLMLDYMGRGYVDAHRHGVYQMLLMKLHAFVGNLYLSFLIKRSSFFTDLHRRSINGSFSIERVGMMLENFVTDMAMISLEPEDVRAEKERKIYADHTRFMQQLFCYIAASRQWSDAETRFYTNTLLSPLVDTADAQLIVSAITVALVNIMDPGKFSTLMDVYLKSTDERIRQRALVGWVFSFSTVGTELPSVKKRILDAVKDSLVVADLADLQKQMIFCVNAERDTETIRKDIMPELIRNNNLNITRFGITEKDETEDDIFDPGAADRRMEKMEESFQKMMNMQKAGSDIYFGGFSQMKRFPFFYNPANWFMPFFSQHPDISKAAGKVRNSRVLEHLFRNNMFCESDKYSFAIALSSIVDKLPPAMVEMLDSKEAVGPSVSPEDNTPAYIRRLVLQDMYRFFKLYYPQSAGLNNPFRDLDVMFIVKHPLCDSKSGLAVPEVNGALLELAQFMYKQKHSDGMHSVLVAFSDKEDARYWMLDGLFSLEMEHDAVMAWSSLQTANEKLPGNKRILSLLARAYFEDDCFADAAAAYGDLYELDPSNKTVTINYCIALSKAKRYDEAAGLLYKLTFESEGNTTVTRVLAWTLMGQNKLEQAEREYAKLLASPDTETGDYLNAAYCRWFMQDIPEAVSLFRRFVSVSNNLAKGKAAVNIENEMLKDRDILSDHGIGDIDFNLMVDLLNTKDC